MNDPTKSIAVGILSLAALCVSSPLSAQTVVSASDRAFLAKASESNVGEVAAGNLAQQRGASADTRALGKRFADNHRANEQKLGVLASRLNVVVPMHPSAEDKMEMAKLKALSGSAFDAAFLSMEQKGHMKNIMAFKQEGAATSNPMIAAYTKASIPVLEEHLLVATDDANKMHQSAMAPMH